jgi:hypothetical protein
VIAPLINVSLAPLMTSSVRVSPLNRLATYLIRALQRGNDVGETTPNV